MPGQPVFPDTISWTSGAIQNRAHGRNTCNGRGQVYTWDIHVAVTANADAVSLVTASHGGAMEGIYAQDAGVAMQMWTALQRCVKDSWENKHGRSINTATMRKDV